MASSALEANTKRQAQIEGIFDEIIARYSPGGIFGKSYLQQLEGQKTRDVGAGMQSLISSGLSGTTTTAGLPQKWEAEVGAPSRLKLEDLMMERLSGAQTQKAGFLERIEEPYPDMNPLLQASIASGSSSGGSGGSGGYSVSGSSGLPTNYNPLTDPSRHSQNISGSVSESISSTGGSTGGSSPPPASAELQQSMGQQQAQQAAKDNPGTVSEFGNDAWVLEDGIMRHLRKHPRDGYWMRVG